jgi:glycyl-tRNA synthetase beta subunit
LPSLLLEIGCEELPASACVEAEAQLRSELAKLGEGQVFVGPRRLVLLVDELPEREPDEWVKGPPEHLRDRAAAGFAKKQGVSVEELEVRDGFLGVLVAGKPLLEALPERLHAIVRGLAFSKSMRWADSGLRFARPVRWLCAKLDDQTVEGFGGSSYGHRFTHGETEVPRAGAYLETLRAAQVEPDPASRESLIRAGLEQLGLRGPNERVLAEVVHLAEWPTVLEGTFDQRFLTLPRRVIETAMESHQRYFPLEDNRFAFVANGGDAATVVAGNEGVLEGRLEDASFTFERDVAKGIERLAEESARITFVAGAISAPSTRASPAFRRRSVRRSTSSTCRIRPAVRSRKPRPGACSPPPTRSTASPSLSRSTSVRPGRETPTGSAARGSGSAGSRSKATSSSTWTPSRPACISCSSTRVPS